MTDQRPHPQVIRSVETRGHGRSKLVLQSICGGDGRRYLRAQWEFQGDDGEWQPRTTPPEFSGSVWSDVLAKAARAGMLSSNDYKGLLVRLAQGLDSSKSPTPKAFVRFTGILTIQFGVDTIRNNGIDEVMVYEALGGPGRDVTVTQSFDEAASEFRLDYVVEEDIHYMEALARLPENLRDLAGKSSMEEAISSDVPLAFHGLFGDPGLEAAGFRPPVELDYALSIL